MESGVGNGERLGGREMGGRRETHNGQTSSLDRLWELERDVRKHIVVLRPFRVRRVQVEARAFGRASVGKRIGWGRTHQRQSPSCPSRRQCPRLAGKCLGREARCPPLPRHRRNYLSAP